MTLTTHTINNTDHTHHFPWQPFTPTTTHTTQTILCAVAYSYQLHPNDITGPQRTRNITQARHITAWILYHHAGLSYPQTAQALNRNDHTTAMNSIKRIRQQLKTDTQLALEIETITNGLNLT